MPPIRPRHRRRYLGKAEINQPTIPAESVENYPMQTCASSADVGSLSAAQANAPRRVPVSPVGPIPFRTLCGRRVEVDIKSRDLAVPCDDEIHTGVLGRFAFRPRAPRQASRIVQNLGRAMMRINELRMRRSKAASELVRCVMTDERARRRV